MMAKNMKSKKKLKNLAVKPKLSSYGAWSRESEARLQEFMAHAIGRHADAYLKNLAMTVVHLKAISEISALQSDLQREKTEIALARHQLNLEREKSKGFGFPCGSQNNRSRQ